MNPSRRRTFLKQLATVGAVWPVARRAMAQEPPWRPKIRVGQMGVGHAHAGKLAVYRQSPDYEVVGLVVENDPELQRKADTQAAFKDVPRMTQEQLLNVPGVQVVLVETRVRELLDTAAACIAAGKHVHIDKPAGESLSQFKRIVAAAARQKLMIQLGYMYRYNPAIVRLREFLHAGWLGDVFELHAVMSKTIAPAEREKLAEYPGGMMFELGCHLIDLVIGLLGKPQQITPFAQHASSHSDRLLDNMLAVFTYDRALATVKTAAMEYDGFQRRHLVVCGSEGTFHVQPLDNPTARVTLSQPRGQYRKGPQELTFPRYSRYVADAADMARVIRGEKANDFPYEHELAVQEAVLRASGI